MVSLKRDPCKMFCFGLHHDIQIYLVAHDMPKFDKLADKAEAIKEVRIVTLQTVMGLDEYPAGIMNHITLVEMSNATFNQNSHGNRATLRLEKDTHPG
ncbi:hypothetical protein EPI10_020826 [Gossypium australe]|uniref:Uncharacterized protein n=1 Tax=Gossypium australe TaxID=47621 RepID=A0A5B6WH53_9ROSI|nr:hypothetical protein EPI10_020826 [Gossypium australe]